MNKKEFIQALLKNHSSTPDESLVSAYAPSNIALVKYWGKRNTELNLPVTSSLSISLAHRGVTTSLKLNEEKSDTLIINGKHESLDSSFGKRLIAFLDLFRPKNKSFHVITQSNLPTAAGFAALTLALDLLFNWHLSDQELSIIARLGSGSAARSLWNGFVEWHKGTEENGLDSFAQPLDITWSELRSGLLILDHQKKLIGSREAMNRTVKTSPFYSVWPQKVERDLQKIKKAIMHHDFTQLGEIAENNALAMHATMITAHPPVLYWQAATIAAMHAIWQLRKEGVPVYFTEDAGANLKLLFLKGQEEIIFKSFPDIE